MVLSLATSNAGLLTRMADSQFGLSNEGQFTEADQVKGHIQHHSYRQLEGTSFIITIIIIVAFGPVWIIHRQRELSRHPDPGPVCQVVPRCSPSSLFQLPDRGAWCFLVGLAFSFPVDARSGLDVWCRSLAFGGLTQSIFSVRL